MTAYQDLQASIYFDAVILIDGGTDALMRGDEPGLGTPAEDISSIYAVANLSLRSSYLACIGLGIETFDGIKNASTFGAIEELQQLDALQGVIHITKSMPGVKEYSQAITYANKQYEFQSLVQNAIKSAIEGKYGTQVIGGKKHTNILVSTLMQQYWIFDLAKIKARMVYPSSLSSKQSLFEVNRAIEQFRSKKMKSFGIQV